MTSRGLDENGLNWEDVHIAYHDLYTVVRKAVAGLAHLYGYGIRKCNFLSELLIRPFSNCRILTVLSLHLLNINAGAACLFTNFPT